MGLLGKTFSRSEVTMSKSCGLCKSSGTVGAVNDSGKVVRMTCPRCGGSGR